MGGVSVTPSAKGNADEYIKPGTININRACTKFAAVFDDCMAAGKEASPVFLGDNSGSMAGSLLKMLKTNMIDLIKKAVNDCGCVGVGFWNDKHSLFFDSNGNNWVTKNNLGSAEEWIKGVPAGSSTFLKQAVDGALDKFGGKATDVYVLTDGEMHDFNPNADENYREDFSLSISATVAKWKTHRAKYPDVTFHFIAIGEAAEAGISELLERMAHTGGGTFSQFMK